MSDNLEIQKQEKGGEKGEGRKEKGEKRKKGERRLWVELWLGQRLSGQGMEKLEGKIGYLCHQNLPGKGI